MVLGGGTVLAEANFFSVLRMAPERAAALRADLPLTTVSRAPPPPGPRALVPMRVTLSHSWSAMLGTMELMVGEVGWVEGWVVMS